MPGQDDHRSAIPAPLVSPVMTVEPQWIDYNGHLNMAYYNVLFDRAVDEVYEILGVGPSYLKRTGNTTMTAEVHVRYRRELHVNAPVRVRFQLLNYDEKRIHYFGQLVHAEQGWLSASSENLAMHVNIAAKKVMPWPQDAMAAFARMKQAHDALAVPADAGRRITMPVKRD